MHYLKILHSTRPPFLVLTLACVFLGVSSVIYQGHSPDNSLLALVFTGALLSHISVNTLNEYLDFKSGLDLTTRRTPFSGGSGNLPVNPELAGGVLTLFLISLTLTVLIGLYLVYRAETTLLIPIGLAGVLLILLYTGPINRNPWICLLAPGFGFGLLMVLGTQLVLNPQTTGASWSLALIPFFLVNNLLLLNQYPDLEADAAIGRYHFPIAFGASRSNLVYGLFILLSALIVAYGVMTGLLPALSLLALLPLALSVFSLSGAIRHQQNIGRFPVYLAANVASVILTPSILGLTLIV